MMETKSVTALGSEVRRVWFGLPRSITATALRSRPFGTMVSPNTAARMSAPA
jgi:hypothetical protein